MADGKVVYKIEGDNSGFSSAVAQTKSIAASAAHAIGSAFKMTAAAAGAAVAGAVAVGTKVISVGSQYQTAVAKVKTIADTTSVSIEEVSQAILDLSNDTGVAAEDLAEAVYSAISGGVDTAAAVDFVATANRLAAGGFTTAATAVDVLTTAINAYGLEATDAEAISDKLITTQNLGKTTVDELAASMGKVIPLAAAYGVNIDQLSTGYVALTKTGIATAEATTYMKSMFTELADSGSDVSAALKEIEGVDFTEFMKSGGSLQGALMAIAAEASGCGSEFKKLRSEGLSASEAYAQLAAEGQISATAFSNMWGSVEAGTGALAILQTDAAEMEATLQQMQDSAGTTQTAYETMTATLRHSWDTLKNELKNLGISMFEQLGTPLSNAVSSIGEAVSAIGDSFGSGEGGLSTIVDGAASAIQSFADGVSGVVTGIKEGAFADTIGGLKDSLGGIGDAVSGFIENVGQINTSEVLASAVVAVGLVSDAISSVITWAGKLAGPISEMISAVGGITEPFKGVVTDAFDPVVEAIGGLISAGANLVSAFGPLVPAVVSVLQGVAGQLETVVSAVTAAVNAIIAAVQSALAWLETLEDAEVNAERAEKRETETGWDSPSVMGGAAASVRQATEQSNARAQAGQDWTGIYGYQVGEDFVASDWQKAFLHYGERVMTKEQNRRFMALGGLRGMEAALTGGTHAAAQPPVVAQITLKGDVFMDGYSVGKVVLENLDDVAAFTLRG